VDHAEAGVQVSYWLNYLSKNSSGCEISNRSIGQLAYEVSQANAFDVVSNKKYLFFALNQVVQVDNPGVVKLFQHYYLTLASFLLHRILQFRLIVNFDCILFFVPIIKAKTYLGIGPLSDRLADLIVV